MGSTIHSNLDMKNSKFLSSLLALSLTTSIFSSGFKVSAEEATTADQTNKIEKATIRVDGDPAVNYINHIFASENIYLDKDSSRIVYCLNENLRTPNGQMFSSGPAQTNPKILSALYHGFPSNATGLQEKHGLTNSQARYYTQVVIWHQLGGGASASINSNIPFYNELLALSDKEDLGPERVARVNRPVSKLNLSTDGSVQETELIHITGTSGGTFTFPSDSNFWSVDEAGNRKNSFKIGDKFKIQTSSSFNGNKTFTVNTQLMTMKARSWISPDPGVQNVLEPLPTSTVPYNLNVEVASDTTSIAVTKSNESGGKLQGVTFGLYSDANAKNEITRKNTDSNGRAIFDNLALNRAYYIKEISALPGYVLSSDIHKIDTSSSMERLNVVNRRIVGSIRIIKTDGASSKPIPNTHFNILDSGNKVVETVITDKDGIATSKTLPYGIYKVIETKAGDGYILDSTPKTIAIENHNSAHPLHIQNNSIYGNISINKIDSKTKKPLSGVKFDILDTNDKKVKSIVTDINGVANSESLPYGTYYFVETEALDGYLLDKDKTKVVISENNKTYPHVVENKPIQGTLNFTKTDLTTGEVIDGAKIKITGLSDHNKDFTLEFTSSKDGNSFELDYGKYQIEETLAPEGYIKTTEKGTFDITEDGAIIKANIKNKLLQGTLKFSKVDDLTKDIIAGAKIEIKGISNHNKDFKLEFTSSKNSTEIPLDYGEYSITEIAAPEGYLKKNDILKFKIQEEGQIETIDYSNTRIIGSFRLKKLNAANNSALSGAVFGIYDSNKQLISKITTDENGIAELEKLEFGEYFYQEILAPKGFALDSTIHKFNISEHKETIDVIAYNDPINSLPDTSGLSPLNLLAISSILCGIKLKKK